MKCKKCGYELADTTRFCPQCGEKVRMYCTECGKEIQLGTKFCVNCGKPVSAPGVWTEETIKNDEPGEAEGRSDLEKKEIPVSETWQTEKINETDTREAVKTIRPRTEETFWEELNQLGETDKNSKSVLEYFGKKFWIKNLYSYMEEGEQVVALHHIVHTNFATVFGSHGSLHVKEFLAITNKRVIKFVKTEWLKPKIVSCYLSEISSIEAAKPGNFLKGIFIGERLRIHTSEMTIKIRSSGKGTAQQIEQKIQRLISESKGQRSGFEGTSSGILTTGMSAKKGKGGLNKVLIAGIGVCAICAAIGIFMLPGKSGGEVSESLSLTKAELLKWISKEGLKESSIEDFYRKEGISVILDDNGNIDMLIIDEPGYTLYGLEVGKKYSFEKEVQKVTDHGYEMLQEEENQIIFGVTQKTDISGSDKWIALELDDSGSIVSVLYNRTGAQNIVDEVNMAEANKDEIHMEKEKESDESKKEEEITLKETELATEIVSDDIEIRDYQSGIYEGSALGFGGEIKEIVTIEDSQIQSVELIGNEEAPTIGGEALVVLASRIENKGSAEVDVVAGATNTSKGAIEAVQAALDKAEIGEETGEYLEVKNYQPGVYEGSASGFMGEIKAIVTIEDSQIQSVELIGDEETPGIGKDALEILASRIESTGSAEIDMVAGATYTSKGVIEAVQIALDKAKKGEVERGEESSTPEHDWGQNEIEYGIKLEDVWSGTYSSDGVPVKMQLGQTENGYYIQFYRTDTGGYDVIWSGYPDEYMNTEYGGLSVLVIGEDYSQGLSGDALIVEWDSMDTIDHPNVYPYYEETENYAITGGYSF